MDGKSMAEWVGDWGLDDALLNVLENATPPHLWVSETQTELGNCAQILEEPRFVLPRRKGEHKLIILATDSVVITMRFI